MTDALDYRMAAVLQTRVKAGGCRIWADVSLDIIQDNEGYSPIDSFVQPLMAVQANYDSSGCQPTQQA